MDNHIRPHSSIIEALESDSPGKTPFSCIPLFIRKYLLIKDSQEKLTSILSSLGEQELQHLNAKIEPINGMPDSETYNQIRTIEAMKKPEFFIGLAKQIVADEMGDPVRQILRQVEAKVCTGIIDVSHFHNPHKDISEGLSDEEKLLIEQEQQVRIIMNALIMGAGHRIFDRIDSEGKYSHALDKVHTDLYQAYYDRVYNNLASMREIAPTDRPGGVNTGSMQLVHHENGDKVEVKVDIQADIFPVLLHEIAKGVIEYIAYSRYNTMKPEIIQSILSVDSRAGEHWMMLVGPQIYKQLFFLIKEAIAQYNDSEGIIDGKKESDYIIPIISYIIQLPADEFLSFIETILRKDGDGDKSVALIISIIDAINTQYEAYLKSINAPQMSLTIEKIIEQLEKEFREDPESESGLSEECKKFITAVLPEIQQLLQEAGYINAITDKKLGRKLAEHFPTFAAQYPNNETYQGWLSEMQDTISGFKKSRIEVAGFAKIHEKQKKLTKYAKNHAGQKINIHPKFTLTDLEQAKKEIDPKVIGDIDNQIGELIQNGTITAWLKDHDTMSTRKSQLTEKFITLDDIAPECLMEWEGNRGLYELTNIEQLKREAQMMGGHCVPDKIGEVKNGSLIILSLRRGTESRWTIGYQPRSKSISQVKGYVDGRKNAFITKDNPDIKAVIHAINYICQSMEVNQINDMDAYFSSGENFATSKGILSKEEFFCIFRKSITPFEIDIIPKLQSIGYIGNGSIELRGLPIKLTRNNGNNTKGYLNITESEEVGLLINCLKEFTNENIPEESQITDFIFGRKGINKNHVVIKNKLGNYGIMENINGQFTIVLDCKYGEIPEFQGLLNDEAFVKKGGKYGIINYQSNILLLDYILESVPVFGKKGLLEDEALASNRDIYWSDFSVIKRQSDGSYCILLEGEEFYGFGQKGLPINEALIEKNGRKQLFRRQDDGSYILLLLKQQSIGVLQAENVRIIDGRYRIIIDYQI